MDGGGGRDREGEVAIGEEGRWGGGEVELVEGRLNGGRRHAEKEREREGEGRESEGRE